MKLRAWLIIATALYALFGLGLLFAPAQFMILYGVQLGDSGVFMSRILGAALTGFALLFWWGRDADASGLMAALLRAAHMDIPRPPYTNGG